MKNLVTGFFWFCLAAIGLLACNRYENDVFPKRKASRNILHNDAFAAYLNQNIRLQVLNNDTIVTDGELVFRKPLHGTIITDSAGFVYQPASNFQGEDVFHYTFCSGQVCDSALVSVTVGAAVPNCTVKANSERITFNAPNPVIIPVLANDVTCGPVIINTIRKPLHGKITLLAGGRLQYSPSNGYIGKDSLTYEIQTPDGRRSAAQVWVEGYLNCTIFAKNDLANTTVNDSVTIYPTRNDVTCNAPVTLSVVSNPQHGKAKVLTNNRISYEPDMNFTGADVLIYRICDAGNQCSQSTITINTQATTNCVTGFAALNDTLALAANTAVTGVYLDVLANDVYCLNQLTSLTVTQPPVMGTFTVVTQNGVPQIHYVKSGGGSAPFTDFLGYQVCMLVNGQVVCKSAQVNLKFN